MQAAARWILLLMLAFSLVGLGPAQRAAASIGDAPLLQGTQLIRTVPEQCPPGGCAGGQRLAMSFEFNLTGVSLADDGNPNVKVCIYAPGKWVGPLDTNHQPKVLVNVAGQGENTQTDYTPENSGSVECSQDGSRPAGYTLIAERWAALAQATPRDALRFAFRTATDATGKGGVIARLFARTTSGWDKQPTRYADSANFSMASTPIASTAYAANTAAECGTHAPCYINSDDDAGFGNQLNGGISTGLKDAVDVVNAVDPAALPSYSVLVTGTYAIGSNTVAIATNTAPAPTSLTVGALGAAKITFTGPADSCKNAMLSLNSPVTLRDLNISSGSCTTPRRDLITINSPEDGQVQIEANDLTGGKDAIAVNEDNKASLLIRFNDITNNSGYALRFTNPTGTGASSITMLANNITGNKAASQVDCGDGSDNRRVDHNYWGGNAPSSAATHCRLDPQKRLGARITDRANANGVNAKLVNVTQKIEDANSAFSGQIRYYYTGTESQSPIYLYIIDHGYLTLGGPPFSYYKGEASPSPCSNNWDVFMVGSLPPGDKLKLTFKYNKNPACQMAINSSQYCDQTSTPGKYPLFWYDPDDQEHASGVTSGWDLVGARPGNLTTGNGAELACNPDTSEITLSLDKDPTHHPNLADLGYTPFMVGVPVIKDFMPLAEYGKVQVKWSTNNEPDIEGFYVLHGTDKAQLTRMTDLITSDGDASSGYSYYEYDPNRVNGTTYYYRLQVMRNDGYSFYSDIIGVKVQAATSTSPPPTRTPTKPYPTWTPWPTPVYTKRPTLIPTWTLVVRTRTPTATFPPLSLATRTPTPVLDTRTPGVVDTLNAMATEAAGGFNPLVTQVSGTPGASGTGVATPTTGAAGAAGTGTPVSALGSTTPSPSTSLTAVGGAVENASRQPSPWLSLFLGILAGGAVLGGAGGLWYYLMRR